MSQLLVELPSHNAASGPQEQVPTVNLPYGLDRVGLPEICPVCGWNGNPRGFMFLSRIVKRRYLETAPLWCIRCRVLLALEDATRSRGTPPQTEDRVYAHWDGQCFQGGVDFSARSERYLLFIPSYARMSYIDKYCILPRQEMTAASVESCAGWAQTRIEDCLRSHENCRSQTDIGFLPTRLIDVSPGGEEMDLDVRLLPNASVPPGSRYAALSYCWGDYEPDCITNSTTVSTNMARIPWITLPNTFRDAVKVTRCLGLKYLWIDSICIIQGDDGDWHREAGHMFHVYSNAHLTLAALFGHDSTSGLRTGSILQQSKLLAQLRLGETTYPLYMRPAHYLSRYTNDMNNRGLQCTPLLKRAWAFQELMVSPRVLFFTESEAIYQCTQNVECECTCIANAKIRAECLPKSKIFNMTRSTSNQRKSDTTRRDSFKLAETWRRVVARGFSGLHLTEPRDRLSALGAIAEQFQRVRPSEDYLAGLWSGSLLHDLLWSCSDGLNPRIAESKKQLDRPYSLPTWSWASSQSGIEFVPLWDKTEHVAAVVESRCSYAKDNPFGVLESSNLILQGRVLCCTLEWEKGTCKLVSSGDEDWRDLNRLVPVGVVLRMDHDKSGYQSSPEHQEVHLLEILRRDSSNSRLAPNRYFLVLRREGQEGHVYTRGGLFFTMQTLGHELGSGPGKSLYQAFLRAFDTQSTETRCEIR